MKTPDTMKADAFARTGGIEVLEPVDLPVPEGGPDDVLVRVRACGLNHLDLWVRQGLPIQIPMPLWWLRDRGQVARIGSAVKRHCWTARDDRSDSRMWSLP